MVRDYDSAHDMCSNDKECDTMNDRDDMSIWVTLFAISMVAIFTFFLVLPMAYPMPNDAEQPGNRWVSESKPVPTNNTDNCSGNVRINENYYECEII